MRLWIRSPLAVLPQDAAGGFVVEGGRIVETLAAGASPVRPVDETFDASRHVVIPGLVNTHHHLFQNLTRATPAGQDAPLFGWLQAHVASSTATVAMALSALLAAPGASADTGAAAEPAAEEAVEPAAEEPAEPAAEPAEEAADAEAPAAG